MERKQLGVIGVDSGQVMVMDPCYVDNEWVYAGPRKPEIFRNTDTDEETQDFETYRAWNLAGANTVRVLPEGWLGGGTYEEACRLTGTEAQGGELNYGLGHAGLAVVSRAGLGDGVYPVYAEYQDIPGFGKRVTRLVIEFMED